MNVSGYLDVFGACQIDIEGDILRGNEDTIRSALRLIKRTDRATYRRFCAAIETISERYCIDADWHLDQSRVEASARLPGCYLRGTDVIYLRPEQDTSETRIRERADTIRALAGIAGD